MRAPAVAAGLLAAALLPGCVDFVCAEDGDCDAGKLCSGGECVTPPPPSPCGNGITEAAAGEGCDDGDLNGPGQRCSEHCVAAECGDRVVQTGEECDEGPRSTTCLPDCRRPFCGDGRVGGEEECDEGTDSNGDPFALGGCTKDCTVHHCGDAAPQDGEECDSGLANGSWGEPCSIRCTRRRCGDGIRDPGEACDGTPGCNELCEHGDLCAARSIWAGSRQTYVLREDNKLVVWGQNRFGELGLPAGEPVTSPTEVPLGPVAKIAVGLRFAVVLTPDGELFTIGDNGWAGRGAGDMAEHPGRTPIPGGPWKDVSAGQTTVLAITRDGRLFGWGRNAGRQLGDVPPGRAACLTGQGWCVPGPVELGGGPWRAVASGGSQVVALKDDFTVWTWGGNGLGQLGDGVDLGDCLQTLDPAAAAWDPRRLEPLPVAGLPPSREVFAGLNTSFVLDGEGALHAFGSNCFGELDQGAVAPISTPLTLLLSIQGPAPAWQRRSAMSLSSSHLSHTVVLARSGQVVGFGIGNMGQLGPRQLAGGPAFSPDQHTIELPDNLQLLDAAVGHSHTVLLAQDGSVFTFGNSSTGDLGQGFVDPTTQDAHPAPTRVNLCAQVVPGP